MSLIYKTLFEIKIAHEYYLTRANGDSIFSLASQRDRINFIKEEYTADQYSINNDLDFTFPIDLEKIYENYNLKLLSTYSGFKVAIRVNKKLQADGSLLYEPLVPLPGNLGIHVLISKSNFVIDSYTNKRLNVPFSAHYLFSNSKFIAEPVFPFLTSTVSAIHPGYIYEQGELVSFGPNDIRGYYLNDAGEQWIRFAGKGFVNENDRLLVPFKFYYSFPEGKNIKRTAITIRNNAGDVIPFKDAEGNPIDSLVTRSNTAMNKLLVDLSSINDLLAAPLEANPADFVFSLTINTDDDYENTHSFFFTDKYYSANLWAMTSIYAKTSDTDFDLFDADGYLAKRRNAAGTWIEPPVFEIPVKSRFTYWRYKNNKGKKILAPDPLNGYLNEENGVLISKKPRSIARSFFQLQKETGSETKYFPAPLNYDLKIDEKKRLCHDIIVPESDLFPIV